MKVLEARPAHIPRSRACEALGLSRSGSYPRPRRPRKAVYKRQPRALTLAQRQAVLTLFNQERYLDASVRTVYARELSEGRMWASMATMYRLLRAAGQSHERRAQRPPQRHVVPRIVARAPHEAWSWDISKLPTTTRGRYLNLYMVLDLFSRFPVGWMISRKENAALAMHLFRQLIAAHRIRPGQLVIHQDRGAPMIAETFRDLIASLGVGRSYSRPRVSNDNPFSESQFKTLKYAPDYPGRFENLEHARSWVGQFVERYQHTPHEGLGLHTPADVFHGRIETVHAERQAALDAYWRAHPQRFVRGRPHAKRPPEVVAINPDDGMTADELLASTEAATSQPEPVVVPGANMQ